MNSAFSVRQQTPSLNLLAEALASSPAGFAVCPQAFVDSWTPEELEQRQRLYVKAFQKAQRMAAFVPDERIAFP